LRAGRARAGAATDGIFVVGVVICGYSAYAQFELKKGQIRCPS
jgi:hypothetical protein